jgi:hypothetical protein
MSIHIKIAFLVAAGLAATGAATGHGRPGHPQGDGRPVLQLPFTRDHVLRNFPLDRLGFDLPVLRPDRFQALYGSSTEIPRSDAALIALANSTFSAEGRKQLRYCAEAELGIIFAGMANPAISDAARKQVEAILAGPSPRLLGRVENEFDGNVLYALIGGGAVGGQVQRVIGTPTGTKPTFNRELIIGRFRFLYTDNDRNVAQISRAADIEATAAVLNAAWDDFTRSFREPLHYIRWDLGTPKPIPHQTIDVECYALDPNLLGMTSSYLGSMALCSRKVISNPLQRQTTSVHELFHRVQYAYGYVSGTPGSRWFVEGTASWSQKHRAPHVGDWMERMNIGLGTPWNALFSRSYDSCHFWVYLGQRRGSELRMMNQFWSAYSKNGRHAHAAVESVIAQIPDVFDLRAFALDWHIAGIFKDMHPSSENYKTYSYPENFRTLSHPGGVTFGPLREVPRTTVRLQPGTDWTGGSSVPGFGGRYFVFEVAPEVRQVEIAMTNMSYLDGRGAYLEVKNNRVLGVLKQSRFTKNFKPGEIDRIVFIASGTNTGGSFRMEAKSN